MLFECCPICKNLFHLLTKSKSCNGELSNLPLKIFSFSIQSPGEKGQKLNRYKEGTWKELKMVNY